MENVVLLKKSRWRLESNSLKDLSLYVVDVNLDYYFKSLYFTVLDAVVSGKPIIHNWIIDKVSNSEDDVFTVTHIDGNNNTIYKKILKGVKLIGHQCNHNYDSEDEDLQDHTLTFSYEELQTIDNVN